MRRQEPEYKRGGKVTALELEDTLRTEALRIGKLDRTYFDKTEQPPGCPATYGGRRSRV